MTKIFLCCLQFPHVATRTEKRQLTIEPIAGVEPGVLIEQLENVHKERVSIRDGCVLVSGPDSELDSETLIEAVNQEERIKRACWLTYNDTVMEAVIHYYEQVNGELTKVETYEAFGHARAYDYICREYGFDIDEH